MLKLSILDLTPISEGYSSAETLQQSLSLAKHADTLGYQRYWLSEHHNTNMLASASPEILAGQIAAATQRIKVGTGGIMLPNHTPLKVAENFRLLSALFPHRIDLGLGRAPGTDMRTALELRGTGASLHAEDFPQQLTQLLHYLHENAGPIQAVPLDVHPPDVWLLGSSTFSAQLAAARGLPFVFAHHIQPEPAEAALRLYHAQFQATPLNKNPRSMVAVSVLCAESDEAANNLARSADLMWLRFRQSNGHPGPLPSLRTVEAQKHSEAEQAVMQASRQRMFVGSPERVKAQLTALADQLGVEEIMINTLVHDPEARQQSYTLLAEAFDLTAQV